MGLLAVYKPHPLMSTAVPWEVPPASMHKFPLRFFGNPPSGSTFVLPSAMRCRHLIASGWVRWRTRRQRALNVGGKGWRSTSCSLCPFRNPLPQSRGRTPCSSASASSRPARYGLRRSGARVSADHALQAVGEKTSPRARASAPTCRRGSRRRHQRRRGPPRRRRLGGRRGPAAASAAGQGGAHGGKSSRSLA